MKHACQLRIGLPISQMEKLLNQTPEKIYNLIKGKKYPTFQGVYAISDPSDSEIVYVGMTKTSKWGIGGRLDDHVQNSNPSDLNQMVGCKKIAARHLVRMLKIPTMKERRNLEAVAIGFLSPRYNK